MKKIIRWKGSTPVERWKEVLEQDILMDQNALVSLKGYECMSMYMYMFSHLHYR